MPDGISSNFSFHNQPCIGGIKIDFNSLPWQASSPDVRFKVFKQGSKQLRLVEFMNTFIEPDWCTKGHIGYVLKGQIEISFSGTKIIYNPGDGIFIPGGEKSKHMARILTKKVKVILVEDI